MKMRRLFVLGLISLSLLLSLLPVTLLASTAPVTDVPEVRLAMDVQLPLLADFEAGVPAEFGVFSDLIDGAQGAQTSVALMTTTAALPTIPGPADNTVLSFTYNLVINEWGYAYGGFNHDFGETQDWSSYDGFSFWFYGTNTGNTLELELWDGGASGATSERYEYEFVDDVSGWRQFKLPFNEFVYATDFQPTGGPINGVLDLTEMWGYNFGLVTSPSSGTFWIDDVLVYGGPTGMPEIRFDKDEYNVTEGEVATVTVKLSTAPSAAITVTYSITDGTATLGEDYSVLSEGGTLVFASNAGSLVFPSGVTEQSFVIQTIDDAQKESSIETVLLSLAEPQGSALLGSRITATLNIADNESICGVRSTLVDGFDNYADNLPFELTDSYNNTIGFLTFSDGSPVAITTTQVLSGEMLALPGQPMTNTLMRFDSNISGWGGFTHNFENEAGDTWVTQDWSTYEGIALWVYGTGSGVDIAIELQENRPAGATVPGDGGPEVWNYTFEDDVAGWRFVEIPWNNFTRKEIGNGAPNDGLTLEEVHGWAFLSLASGGEQTHYFDNIQVCGERTVVKELAVSFAAPTFNVTEGGQATIIATMNMPLTESLTVDYFMQESGATPGRDYQAVTGNSLVFAPGETTQSFTVDTIDDKKYEGVERMVFVLTNPSTGTIGFQARTVLAIQDDETFMPGLADDFENGVHQFKMSDGITLTVVELSDSDGNALPGQVSFENVLSVTYVAAGDEAGFARYYQGSRNWSQADAFSFWFNGQATSNTVQVEILSDRDPDPGPDGWELVWSDEFNGAVGTPPNPQVWTHEIGDGAINGITGWGNGEFQYYTNSTDNAAMDGSGNLVITARKVPTDSTLTCWYGPCEYTSARLISKDKVDFTYGRIEARVQVPAGAGLWPAFWMLGNNIDQVDWPTSGEIDIVEYVGKDPNGVYGTIHGPGYSGGNAYGSGLYDIGEPVANNFHRFAVEWEPGVIRWYIDDTNFFTATEEALPTVKPGAGPWVYDHPFFLLLNLAVGGNFPGNPDETTPFPAAMVIDYVRVYQAPDSAKRFSYTFVDDFTGWQRISIPFVDFTQAATRTASNAQARSANVNLNDIWGYTLNIPPGSQGAFLLDQVAAMSFDKLYLPVVLK